MTKSKLPFYYLLCWGLYLLYIYADSLIARRGPIPYVWSNLTASFIEFTFCFFVLYPRFLKTDKIPFLVVGLIIADALFVGSRAFIEEFLYVAWLGHGNYNNGTTALYYISDNWWRALQPILFSFLAWALLDTFKKDKETEQLKREKIQAELLFLKTQINPHFLYNTLNYMYSLAYPVSDQLANGLIKLSHLMRYMLNESANGMLDLQKEIDYLQNYIELYQLRFEDEFFVDFKLSGDFAGKKIASLILIPFIENAFKHGVLNEPRRPVKIHIQLTAQCLTLTVSNKVAHGQKDASGGIGLVNIKRRLQLIYPGKHELLISDNGETYKTILTITLKTIVA
ncbi:sensor histidine kinase [Mucilaginibacter segetis]|uniref:Sensor histidine kinase n=1 Tax=Mucilaginibacter segetis TaxID=2793071 RepID=A0A934PSM7_9SPHI|nr:sensor histidine kinase [Mucilaginibacter segetis]MBK0378461.1 sensor histidine kinase [Mucilaginibacter segetis]